MGATTLTSLPSAVYAGDTFLLSITNGTYPADDSWTLTYQFGSDITFSSTNDGGKHLFSVDASTTGTWLPGVYPGLAYVDNGTQRFTVWTGFIEVKAGLSTQPTASDLLPWYFAARDKMQLVISGKAGLDVLNSTIAGQNIGRLTPQQAIEFYEYLKTLCDAYMANLAAENGQGGGRNVKVRFVAT